MQITVFGATGKVGKLVVAEALSRGHSVIAFVHSSSSLPQNTKLSIVNGDVYNPEAVAEAIKGSDAVISALGSWGTPKKDILKSGMENIIPAMQENKVSRIVSLTGHGANAPGDKFELLHLVSRWMLVLLAPRILHDGEHHIEQLAASKLDWTVIRSSLMEERGNPNKFRLTLKRPLPLAMIHRKAVATSLVNLAENKNFNKQSPFILRK